MSLGLGVNDAMKVEIETLLVSIPIPDETKNSQELFFETKKKPKRFVLSPRWHLEWRYRDVFTAQSTYCSAGICRLSLCLSVSNVGGLDSDHMHWDSRRLKVISRINRVISRLLGDQNIVGKFEG